MAKPIQTPEQKAKAGQAFELYATPDDLGKRRSIRAIAQVLGCTPAAVQYWKGRDHWDEQLAGSHDAQRIEAQGTIRGVKVLLRESLLRHIATLNRIINESPRPTDRIRAIQEFVSIAKKLDVLSPDDPAASLTDPFQFKDDITHDDRGTDPGAPEADQGVVLADQGLGEEAVVVDDPTASLDLRDGSGVQEPQDRSMPDQVLI